jgi:hypothetical protein
MSATEPREAIAASVDAINLGFYPHVAPDYLAEIPAVSYLPLPKFESIQW